MQEKTCSEMAFNIAEGILPIISSLVICHFPPEVVAPTLRRYFKEFQLMESSLSEPWLWFWVNRKMKDWTRDLRPIL